MLHFHYADAIERHYWLLIIDYDITPLLLRHY
jgi:hypothetical protein